MFTTNTKEEAEALLSLACSTNRHGEYISRELYKEQTMENLQAFSDRLSDLYHKYINKPLSK